MRLLRSCLAAGCILWKAQTGHAAGASDYLGTWELVIANSGTTFRSCALKLAEDGGKLKGEMVWRWGSVFPLRDGESVSIDDKGQLQLQYGDWGSPLTLRRVGDSLEGSVALKGSKDGSLHYVYGTRGAERSAVAGSWKLSVDTDNGTKSGTIVITDDAGGLRAEALPDDGSNVTVQSVALDGPSRIRISYQPAASGGGSPARFEAEARGDRMTGKIITPDGKELSVTGSRSRQWGAPVKLLAQSGLDGWRAREATDKFRWTCTDGVLTNSDKGDVDIVSTRAFQDFQLHLEFKVVKGGNSGVYLRGRYEVQIQDDFGKPLESHSIGSIYSRVPPLVNAAKPAEEWQAFDITLVGRWLTVKLNGQLVIDNAHLDGITGGALDPFESSPGPLMLQGDHGKVWFRNVTMTPAAD